MTEQQQQTDEQTTETEAPEDIGAEATTDTAEPPADPSAEGTEPPAEDAATFSRDYVQELRSESAGYRTRVRDLEQRLHRVLVEQTGALADPADLEFDPAHLEDGAALQAAIDELLTTRPHLRSRAVVGDVGQGVRTPASAGVDLLGMLRSRV